MAQQLHGLGVVDFLVEILNQSGPLQRVSCTAFLQPGSTGQAMSIMKEMIDGLLASGIDITPVLVSTGYVDILVSTLKAIEQVSVEEVCDGLAVCACDNHQPAPCLCSCSDFHSLIIATDGVLHAILAVKHGKCLPQIEDKLRTATSALRFCIDSGDQISVCVSLGSIDSLVLHLFLLACGLHLMIPLLGAIADWPISDGLLAFMGQLWQVRPSALLGTFPTHTMQGVNCC